MKQNDRRPAFTADRCFSDLQRLVPASPLLEAAQLHA